MFQNRKPFYFVFANDSDKFFLESMIRLGLDQYLWFQLRKDGYTDIYFVKDSYDKITLMLPDRTMLNTFRACRPFGVKCPKSAERFPVGIQMAPDVFRRWFLKTALPSNPGNTAFVFQASAFQKVMEADRTHLDQLISNHPNQKNPIVLAFPMVFSDDNLAMFRKTDSVFAHSNFAKNSLCPPLYHMIHSTEPVRIFESLQHSLGECFIQLGAISFQQLCTMLRYFSFHNGKNWDNDTILSFANFLYWYVYSPGFRAILKEPIRKYDTYWDLYQYLSKPGSIDTIQDRMTVLQNAYPESSLLNILYQLQPLNKNEDIEKSHILLADPLLHKLSRQMYPEAVPGMTLVLDQSRWQAMQEQVCQPYSAPISQTTLFYLSKFLEVFLDSQKCGDVRSAIRAGHCLLFCADNLYQWKDLTQIYQHQDTWLKGSRQYDSALKSSDLLTTALADMLEELDKAPPGTGTMADEALFDNLCESISAQAASLQGIHVGPKKAQAILNEFQTFT